jgi:hypothetical protein
MEEGKEKREEQEEKTRGRKLNNSKNEYEANREQTKFFVDLSKERAELEKIFILLEKANKKDLGREITFKDLALFGISKITDKDLPELKESSLSKREKLERAWQEFNKKNRVSLSFEDFLLKKVGLI